MENSTSSNQKTPRTCPKCNTTTFNLRDKFCIRCGTKLPEVQEKKNLKTKMKEEIQKFCADCGEPIENIHDKFCTNCGKVLRTKEKEIEKPKKKESIRPKFCINCGKPLPQKPNIRFCKYCGKPIKEIKPKQVRNTEEIIKEEAKEGEEMDENQQIPAEPTEEKIEEDENEIMEQPNTNLEEDSINEADNESHTEDNSEIKEKMSMKTRKFPSYEKAGLIPKKADTMASYRIPNPYAFQQEEPVKEPLEPKIPSAAENVYEEKSVKNVAETDIAVEDNAEVEEVREIIKETVKQKKKKIVPASQATDEDVIAEALNEEPIIHQDYVEEEADPPIPEVELPELDDVSYADNPTENNADEPIDASSSSPVPISPDSETVQKNAEPVVNQNNSDMEKNEPLSVEEIDSQEKQELKRIKVAICPKCERRCNVVGKTLIDGEEWNFICAVEELGKGKYLVECPGCGAFFIVDIYMAYPAWEERIS